MMVFNHPEIEINTTDDNCRVTSVRKVSDYLFKVIVKIPSKYAHTATVSTFEDGEEWNGVNFMPERIVHHLLEDGTEINLCESSEFPDDDNQREELWKILLNHPEWYNSDVHFRLPYMKYPNIVGISPRKYEYEILILDEFQSDYRSETLLDIE